MSFCIEEGVGCLEVTVEDFMLVQLLKGEGSLTDISLDDVLGERLLADYLFKVAARAELGEDVEMREILKAVVGV
jgi:hypothetical protein